MPSYPKYFIRSWYLHRFKKPVNLNSPVTFNEKIQWLKLYGGYDRYSQFVDKLAVKEFVKKTVGSHYTIENKQYIDVNQGIILSNLPDHFVIKPTHTSGDVFICREKSLVNSEQLKQLINTWYELDYYFQWFECVYKNLRPGVIVEEFLDDGNGDLRDFKFYCFDGRVEYIHVDLDRFHRHSRNVYSRDWELQTFSYEYPYSGINIPAPEKLDEMINVAETLSKGFPFLRVDLYYLQNKKIKFGELTFFPGAGFERFYPAIWDTKFGEMLHI
ncbi:hypothetical protein ADN00_09295 [Ornatilinea apprima]|uniref:Uncharacterized protein n=1 Tax=Ornatilinea apprima TaxID=1134406 RepID=A0A0P6X5Z3_9CHLR|nr:hypothetical protein ADN00_09295 [Ornatilinea apprima]